MSLSDWKWKHKTSVWSWNSGTLTLLFYFSIHIVDMGVRKTGTYVRVGPVAKTAKTRILLVPNMSRTIYQRIESVWSKNIRRDTYIHSIKTQTTKQLLFLPLYCIFYLAFSFSFEFYRILPIFSSTAHLMSSGFYLRSNI